MNFLEKDLEKIIYETPSEQLRERGIHIYSKRKRQLRIGNYGVADIVSMGIDCDGPWPMFDRYLCIKVFELKQDKVDVGAFLQAVRYVKGIKRWIELNKGNLHYSGVKYQICLVGKTLDKTSGFSYLPDMISTESLGGIDLNVFTYSYEFDGIKFQNEYGYQLTNEGF